MKFRVIVSCCFEAETAEEALELRRDVHYGLEDALVNHAVSDPQPEPNLEEFNLSSGRIDGLDDESRQALEQADA